MKSHDPLTLELIRCRLVAGAQQMAAALWKSAYSTVIREVLDYSTAMFDAHGQMVAQSAQLPFQMMTMSGPLRYLIQTNYAWSPGDAVLLNDPYACAGQHLPDFMVFRPIFSDGEFSGFTGVVAHMIDTGGGAPGSYLAGATEIYQEGLRLPPLKIVQAGNTNSELMKLIALNVREPEKVLGDLSAMIACTAIGERVFEELFKRYGRSATCDAMAEILNGSERQFRARLEKLPAGVFKAADCVDDDGISYDPIRIELALSFRGGAASVDFTGSSAQVRGPVNATLEMTLSSVAYTLMAAVGQGIAKNDGCRRAIEVRAAQGSVLNACSPAPVASRITVCHRVVDVMLQALAQVIPDKVMAGYYGGSNICNLGGYDPKTRKPWVHFEIEVGGWGARPTADGLDGFSAHIHNLANTPAEIVESSSPLRVERYEFIPGSGGDGQFRGGLGLRRDLRALAAGTSLNLLGDRCKFAPAGLFGGKNGSPGAYVLNPDTGHERVLPNKLSNYPLNAGDVVSMRTAGGGGFGDPGKRDPEQIDRDSREGKCLPKEN